MFLKKSWKGVIFVKKIYTPAEIEFLKLDMTDIIRTSPADNPSEPPIDDPFKGEYDKNGWT